MAPLFMWSESPDAQSLTGPKTFASSHSHWEMDLLFLVLAFMAEAWRSLGLDDAYGEAEIL